MHLRMGVPYFIDRDFEELANAKGLQVRGGVGRRVCELLKGLAQSPVFRLERCRA